MPKLLINFKHSTSLECAKDGIRRVLDDFQKKQGSLIKEIAWASDGLRATASGTGFKGSFSLNENEILIELDLSFIALPFKGKIISEMERKLKKEFPKGEMQVI